MPFKYTEPPTLSEFRQGEILSDVQEYQPIYPMASGSSNPQFEKILHPRVIVVTQDCDLLSDYRQRSSTQNLDHPNILLHIMLCDLFEEEEMRDRSRAQGHGSADWRRIKQNQNERYHCFKPASIGESGSGELPTLYLDLKRVFSIPADGLYGGVESGEIKRIAIVPPLFLHDFIQRFYSFHSRIAVPEE